MIRSAGILLHRSGVAGTEVLVAHMGGPFWAGKDAGAWSIPKGGYDPAGEQAVDAARREFREELGLDPPPGPYLDLGEFAYTSGKRVRVFAADGSGFDLAGLVFGEFELEWPPRSGVRRRYPEVDRVEWMPLPVAAGRLTAGQRPAIAALSALFAEGD